MIDNELAASGEEIEQTGSALGALEDVVLLDLEHGEPAAFSRKGILGASSRLFLYQQLVSSPAATLPERLFGGWLISDSFSEFSSTEQKPCEGFPCYYS